MKKGLSGAFALLFFGITQANHSFVVIIPSYNNIKYYKRNLDSLVQQKYTNWRAIYIDDCSTDGTGDAVADYIQERGLDTKMNLIINESNHGALCNIYDAVHSCENHEIIVTLDGDDWFAYKGVLDRLVGEYDDPNTWMTYGSYSTYPYQVQQGSNNSPFPDRIMNIGEAYCQQIPNDILNNHLIRGYKWVSSHLRTFYAGLFKQIYKDDLLLNGEFIKMAWDQAMMFPMLEMAQERSKHIHSSLYIYNMANPINDNKVNAQLQRDCEAYIRSMPPYARLLDRPL